MEQSNISEKLSAHIDYQTQSFREQPANPYEIAVAAAKYARELNDRVRKYFGPEVSVQPRNIAMRKVESPETKIFYQEKAAPAPEEPATGRE